MVLTGLDPQNLLDLTSVSIHSVSHSWRISWFLSNQSRETLPIDLVVEGSGEPVRTRPQEQFRAVLVDDGDDTSCVPQVEEEGVHPGGDLHQQELRGPAQHQVGTGTGPQRSDRICSGVDAFCSRC